MSRLANFISALLIAFFAGWPCFASACAELFLSQTSVVVSHQSFGDQTTLTPAQRYVGLLESMQIPPEVRIELLKTIQRRLSDSRAINPVPLLRDEFLGLGPLRHAFDVILDQPDFDITELSRLIALQLESLSRNQQREQHHYLWAKAPFSFRAAEYAVLPSRRMVALDSESKNKTYAFPYKLEVSKSPITEGQFYEVTGRIVTDKFETPDRLNPITFHFEGREVGVLPENGFFNNLTYIDMIVYLNQLSIQRDLKPVYVNIKGQVILPDTIDSIKKIADIYINAPNEDVSLTEGYRLPTKAELLYFWGLALRAKGVPDSYLKLQWQFGKELPRLTSSQLFRSAKKNLEEKLGEERWEAINGFESAKARDEHKRLNVWTTEPVLIGNADFYGVFGQKVWHVFFDPSKLRAEDAPIEELHQNVFEIPVRMTNLAKAEAIDPGDFIRDAYFRPVRTIQGQ